VPDRGDLGDDDAMTRVEPKVMAVLVCLARHSGELVTKQQLVDSVWSGRPVTDEVVARCISTLRGHLGDDPKAPSYIETLPKRGYRLIAPVEETTPQAARPADGGTLRTTLLRAAAIASLAILAATAVLFERGRAPPPAPERLESIAVLPFANMSQPDDQYLADGLTEELSYTLAQIAGLDVVARTSAFQFRDHDLDVREIGRRINVDSVIEGSVRREGQRLRVMAQLIDARSGYRLWADTFEGEASGVFALQKRVAEGVRESIPFGERANTSRQTSEPESFEAYDLYLRGRYALNQRGRETLYRASALFRQAIALDPAYGPAYIELANTYLLLPSYAPESADEMYAQATETIRRGASTDDSIAGSAAAVQGFIYSKSGDWLQAHDAFRAAVTTPPVSPTTHQWYSHLLGSVGRLREAQTQAELARQSDPLSPVVASRLAIISLWAGDEPLAERQFAISAELGFASRLHVESHLLLLLRQDRFGEAGALARRFTDTVRDEAGWIESVLDCLSGEGDCREAHRRLAADPDVLPREALIAWALLGDIERVAAIASLLESDIEAFEPELLFIRELSGFRQTTRFRELTRAIGLDAYWARAGCRLDDEGIHCPDV
jgi:TolB-like protein/DNA-binding winged helix-turn-helix (wHTH) protein/Tfp pilus assembly protein PilF